MAEVKKTCKNCGKEYLAKSKKSLYCSIECKHEYYKKVNKEYNIDKHKKICPVCEKEFIGHPNRKYCSLECRHKDEAKKSRNLHILERNKELNNKQTIEGYDYVTCPICKEKFKQISMLHFKNVHNIDDRDYLFNLYPNLQMTCNKQIEKNLLGENNPMSKAKTTLEKRKQSSPYSIEHYKAKGLSEEEAISERQKFLDSIDRTTWIQGTNVKYYTRQGYTEEEAKKIIHDKYATNGLTFYINKYGEEEGTKRYNKRIESWKSKIQGIQRSKKQDNFFNDLIKLYKNDISNLYYGDNEYTLTFNNKHIRPDFVDIKNNKIIEFFSDYYHCNPIKYNKDFYNKTLKLTAEQIWSNDEERINVLKNNGYDVLIIWEKEYDKNPDFFINKALKFLNNE